MAKGISAIPADSHANGMHPEVIQLCGPYS